MTEQEGCKSVRKRTEKALSHGSVNEILMGAKSGYSVKVKWQLAKEKGEWTGTLGRYSSRSKQWSVVYDLGDREIDTFIPSPEVVYFEVELIPIDSPVAHVSATTVSIPPAGFVAFRYRRPGSTWHFGAVKRKLLLVSRRIFDGKVVPMGEKQVDLDEVSEVLSIRRLPPLGTAWSPEDPNAPTATPLPGSSGSNAMPMAPSDPSSTAPTAPATTKAVRTTTPPTLGALVGKVLPISSVDNTNPRDTTDEGDVLAMIESTLGDLTCERVELPEGFRRCHASGPRVTDLKGSFLADLELGAPNPNALPHKALAASTAQAHKRILRQLQALPKALQDLPLDKALTNHFSAQKNAKKLKWSTLVTKMATAHGALRLLPVYTTNKSSVMMKDSVIWMQAMKGAAKECKQEVPNQAAAANWDMVTSAMDKEPMQIRKLALLLTWLTCGRGGDVLKLEPNCVEVQETGLMVHFRRGKTVKTRGAYSIFTPMPPDLYKDMFVKHLEACMKEKKRWLFEGVQGSHIKEALRRANPKLEQRSLRRGAIQTLAATNLSDEELLKYSGHTNVQMLRRYLNFGKLSGEGKRLQAQGQALLQSSPTGRQ